MICLTGDLHHSSLRTNDQRYLAGDTEVRIAARYVRRAEAHGLVTGPFTLALHLLGTDIFMKMFDAPGYVGRVMRFCQEVCTAMSGYYLDAGCPIVAMVDPMTSQIGADQFRELVTPYATPVFNHIRARGGLRIDSQENSQC